MQMKIRLHGEYRENVTMNGNNWNKKDNFKMKI